VFTPTTLPFITAITIATTVATVAARIKRGEPAESTLFNTGKCTWPDALLGAMHASLVTPSLFGGNCVTA
jgi:hypothetical protein